MFDLTDRIALLTGSSKGIAAFIGSDEASWITGQALTICGGTYMFRQFNLRIPLKLIRRTRP